MAAAQNSFSSITTLINQRQNPAPCKPGRKLDAALGVRYALGRWKAPARYLDYGSIRIDTSKVMNTDCFTSKERRRRR
jgi:hypothetical protein